MTAGILTFFATFSMLLATIFIQRKKSAAKKYRTLNPIILFFIIWSLVLFLSILQLYNITKPSDEAYYLILLMNFFFFIGYVVSLFRKRTKNYKNRISLFFIKLAHKLKLKPLKPKTVRKIFYIVIFISIVLNIIDCIIVIKYLLEGTPLWQIRNWSLEPFGSSNPILERRGFIENILRQVILPSAISLANPIAIYFFFNSDSKKSRFTPISLAIINIILSSAAGGGGRLAFLTFAGYFAFAYFLYQKPSKKRTKKPATFIIFILAILAIIVATVLRAGFGNLFKQFYTYLALAPTLLSLWLPVLSAAPPTYSLLTTFGIHSYLFRFFSYIGLDSLVPPVFNNAYQTMLNAEVFLNVGYGTANAFVSPVYYFFSDGGWIFVCFASLFFGYIVHRCYQKTETIGYTMRNFTLYCLIMYAVFISFIRVQTVIPAFIISLMLTPLLPNLSSKSNLVDSKLPDSKPVNQPSRKARANKI